MSKTTAKFLANVIFVVHWPIVFVLLFGWKFGGTWSAVYIITVTVTLVTQVILGYCVLTKWEFNLRKKLEPSLSYDYSFLSYYAYKYSNVRVSSKVIEYISISFLTASFIIYIYSRLQ